MIQKKIVSINQPLMAKEYFIELCRIMGVYNDRHFKSKLKKIIISHELPYSSDPENAYGENIWMEIIRDHKPPEKRISYKHAKSFAKKYNISSQREWTGFVRNIAAVCELPFPHNAPSYYGLRNKWVNWKDFLGNSRLNHQELHAAVLNYKDAKNFILKLDITSASEYRELITSKLIKRETLPSNPDKFYSDWETWTEFLAPKYVTYEKAQMLCIKAGIRTRKDFQEARPNKVPSAPYTYYSEDWVSWPDFLATENRSYGSAK